MKVIALYSIKGGVGKTATSVNLAYLAAKNGSQTMLFDLDPQGSASFYFRVKSSKKFNTKVLLKGGKNVDKNIKGTDYEKLDSLPSDLSYRKLDIALDNLKRSKRRLKGILQPYKKEYDYIFIDCPPNITLIAENIFFAADVLLVPIIPTTLSVLTLEKLFVFLKKRNWIYQKFTPFSQWSKSGKSYIKALWKMCLLQTGRSLKRSFLTWQMLKKWEFIVNRLPVSNQIPLPHRLMLIYGVN